MEFKFSKGDEENLKAEPAGEKKNRSAILILLLLLVGGLSYVYFFTGLIKPQETLKPAATPAATQVVKMPLPPRDDVAGKTDAKPADTGKEATVNKKVEPPKIAQATPVAAGVPAEKTLSKPPATLKEEPKKAGPNRPAEKKTAVAENKPAVTDKKSEPNKAVIKPLPTVTPPKLKTSPAKSEMPLKVKVSPARSDAAWSIFVGTYVLEDALSTDMGRVRKVGLDPVVKPGARKKSAMNRLFLSEFADRAGAQAALDKLKRHTSDAFILDHAGKHAVYAGSYLLEARAASEMERLSAAGFKVSLKHTEVAIPTQSLTLGPFKDKKTADSALGKLKAAGVKAAISRQQ